MTKYINILEGTKLDIAETDERTKHENKQKK